MVDGDYSRENLTRQTQYNQRYDAYPSSYSENPAQTRNDRPRQASADNRRSYADASNRRTVSEREVRPYSRNSVSQSGYDAQRDAEAGSRPRSSYQPSSRSRTDTSTSSRSSSRSRTGASTSSRSSSRSRTSADAGYQAESRSRTRQSDERLADYTRRNPSRSGQSPSRANRNTRNRAPRQATGGAGFASRALQFLGSIVSAIISFFEWLQARIPVLQRLSAPVLAIATLAVVLVLVGGISFASKGPSNAPDANEVIAVNIEEQAEESAASENLASTVNPDEPADLTWRDSEFAIDTSFHSWSTKDNGRKVVYLTIDDGPSQLTEQFLDMLDRYNAKATFFVTGNSPEYFSLIREAYNRGHTIGLHTMTHDYAQVYASEQAYYSDLEAVGNVVKEQIGYVPFLIRFPGGSSNGMASQYEPGLMQKLANGVQARGYQYYDWSLSSGDGEVRSAEELIAQSTEPNGAGPGLDPTKDTNIVLLCHDSATKQSTLDALPTIIESYQKRGYSFEALDRTSWVCHHAIFDDSELEADSSEDPANTDADTGNGANAVDGNATDVTAPAANSEYGSTGDGTGGDDSTGNGTGGDGTDYELS